MLFRGFSTRPYGVHAKRGTRDDSSTLRKCAHHSHSPNLLPLSEHDLQLLPPSLIKGNQSPIYLWGEVAQDRVSSRMNTQSGSDQQQQRWCGGKFASHS